MLGLGHQGPTTPVTGWAAVRQSRPPIHASTTISLYSVMSYLHPQDPTANFSTTSTTRATGTLLGTVGSTGTADGLPDPTTQPRVCGQPTTPMIWTSSPSSASTAQPSTGPLHDGSQIFGFHTNIAGDVGDYFNFHHQSEPDRDDLGRRLRQHARPVRLYRVLNHQVCSRLFHQHRRHDEQHRHRRRHLDRHRVGSQGTDTITGNDHSNTLTGGPLADKLSGGGGDDTLRGGGGGDKLDGGAGINNTATYVQRRAASSPTCRILASIPVTPGRHLHFDPGPDRTPFADVLTGDGAGNIIHGGAGDDVIYGGGGSNTLEGDADNDTLFAEGVNEGFFGGTGNDTVDYSLSVLGLARTGITADLKFPATIPVRRPMTSTIRSRTSPAATKATTCGATTTRTPSRASTGSATSCRGAAASTR